MSCNSCGKVINPGDRFCPSCGASQDVRCETCGMQLPTDASFCPSCGSPTQQQVAIETPGEERKVVSVIFADLVGFTASSDGADPEDVRRRVQPFHTAMREVVEGFGGRIEKLMGDGVLAVFGAPIAHEDDAERAVRAALQIQERIEDMAGGSDLRARAAVGTGEAMVLVEGTADDREGLVGDVVNTASRLQGEAEPGSVLVDEATHRATRRAFHYEERPPVVVRGKSEPLQVWVPLEPIARLGADLEDAGATLVGRSTELSLLVDTFGRAVHDQRSQIITITGEPGVGKSRMVRELRRHISDLPDLIRWRQGRCLPYGEGITYWALGEVVKAEAGILETDTPATSLGKLTVSLEPLLPESDERGWINGRLAPLVGSDHEATSDNKERFAAWHRYLSSLAEQRPTVIVIEDLHWADAHLVEFLADVPEATRGTPLLLVCTARPDFFESHETWGSRQRDALTIRLEPLDEIATAQLLDELLAGEGLDHETRQMVLDRSGGNPLWAQEFVRMLKDRTATSDLAIPDTVQAVVASRIDLLDAAAKSVIQAASTVGKSFWMGSVASLLSDVSEIEESLRELSRRELIRRERNSTVAGEVEFAFTHSVVRDVAYRQTPRAVRADRHHQVARWIEAMAGDRVADRAEVIAHHDAEALRLASATEMQDVSHLVEHAIESHRRAALQAGRLDLTKKVSHLEAALELSPTVDNRRAWILYDLADAYDGQGSIDIGTKTLLEAIDAFDSVGDHEGWGVAMSDLARYTWVGGESLEAEQYIAEGLARMEQRPPGPALAALYAQEAGRLWLLGNATSEALELVDRVGHIVEVHGDEQTRRRWLSAEGGVRFEIGDPSAVRSFRQVLRMAVESDDSLGIGSAHLNLGEQLRTGWGLEEAMAVHQRGLDIADQRKMGGVGQFIRASLATDQLLSGHWAEAEEQLKIGMAMPDQLAYMQPALVGPKLMIDASRRGATEEMVLSAKEMVSSTEEMRDLQAVIPAYETLMWMHMLADEEPAAIDVARRIVDRAGPTRYLIDAWPLTAWFLRKAGELSRIADISGTLESFDMPRPQAQIRWFQALVGEANDPRAARDELDAVATKLAEMELAVSAAVALAESARISLSLGEPASAETAKSRALALMDRTGAIHLLASLGLT